MGLDIDFYIIKNLDKFLKAKKADKKYYSYKKELDKKYSEEYYEFQKKYNTWFVTESELADKENRQINFDGAPVEDYLLPEEDLKLNNYNREMTELYESCGFDYTNSINSLYMRKQNWMVNYVNERHPEYIEPGKSEIENNEYVPLTREDIKELIRRMKIITDAAGWNFSKRTKVDKIPPKKAIKLAAKLLPTAEGFFFGNTDYDSWYMCALHNYMIKFEETLSNLKDDEHLVYCANW